MSLSRAVAWSRGIAWPWFCPECPSGGWWQQAAFEQVSDLHGTHWTRVLDGRCPASSRVQMKFRGSSLGFYTGTTEKPLSLPWRANISGGDKIFPLPRTFLILPALLLSAQIHPHTFFLFSSLPHWHWYALNRACTPPILSQESVVDIVGRTSTR